MAWMNNAHNDAEPRDTRVRHCSVHAADAARGHRRTYHRPGRLEVPVRVRRSSSPTPRWRCTSSAERARVPWFISRPASRVTATSSHRRPRAPRGRHRPRLGRIPPLRLPRPRPPPRGTRLRSRHLAPRAPRHGRLRLRRRSLHHRPLPRPRHCTGTPFRWSPSLPSRPIFRPRRTSSMRADRRHRAHRGCAQGKSSTPSTMHARSKGCRL